MAKTVTIVFQGIYSSTSRKLTFAPLFKNISTTFQEEIDHFSRRFVPQHKVDAFSDLIKLDLSLVHSVNFCTTFQKGLDNIIIAVI